MVDTNSNNVPPVVTSSIVNGTTLANTVANHAEKPEKFFGLHFKRFLEFKMVDAKTVMSQVQDLQVVLHVIHAEGLNLSETFQVAAMIEKLPPSWVDFKNYLKHKRKEMSVEDLIVRLRIDEDNKLALKKSYVPESAKENVVEAGQSSNANKGKAFVKGNGKMAYLGPKGKDYKNKFKCYNCGKLGHKAADYRFFALKKTTSWL
ncbi:retrovirus-related pol polyprotein from transposon TNT 1-94 [Tanacetum coccineum]